MRAARPTPRRLKFWLLLMAAGFLVAAVIGFTSRHFQFKELQETTGMLDQHFVEIVRPEKVT